jgi:haloacetate dehalogenase
MFEGFIRETIPTAGATVHVRRGGSGPPLLLLHGIPQTHVMWERVAVPLARHFTVVAADLPGYGDSGKPPSTPDHEPYSKRAMARVLVEAMSGMGFEAFHVAGHDRGGRVAYRLALDHPDRATKLAVLDIVPTGEVFRRMDGDLAHAFWVWLLLSQPADVPERIVGANPRLFLDYMLDQWSANPRAIAPEARAEYAAAFGNPESIHAICEEYRAAGTLDRSHDDVDRGRRRIQCPVLALWSGKGVLDDWDVLGIWREWAHQVSGRAIDCGHFLPEEAPEEVFAEMRAFFL